MASGQKYVSFFSQQSIVKRNRWWIFKKTLCGQKMNGARVEDTQKKESKVIVQINQLSVPLLGHR